MQLRSLLVVLLLGWHSPLGSGQDPSSTGRINHGGHHHNPHLYRQPGAVTYLVNDWTSDRGRKCWFNKSMDLLVENFLPHNPVPVILFHDDMGHDDEEAIRQRWPTLDIWFEDVSNFFGFPKGWKESGKELHKDLARARKPTYGHMCRFWFSQFSHVPVLTQFRYMFRLDTDSCIMTPINFNIFTEMRQMGYVYGFEKSWPDPHSVVAGLQNLTVDFLRNSSITPAHPERAYSNLFDRTNGKQGRMMSFATNLEIIDLQRWNQPDVQSFVNVVEQSYGIYTGRWGDAPLRYAVATVFFPESAIVHLCEFGYQHSMAGQARRCNHRSPGMHKWVQDAE